jgi:hypothetical protein
MRWNENGPRSETTKGRSRSTIQPQRTGPSPFRPAFCAASDRFASGIETLQALLMFYNQVAGLPAAWVSAPLGLTLIFDAIIDPLIGECSDRTRSRWGRRHPFMYASAVPLAIAFYFLHSQPLGWSQRHLLVHMVATLVTVRVLLSIYEIPLALPSGRNSPSTTTSAPPDELAPLCRSCWWDCASYPRTGWRSEVNSNCQASRAFLLGRHRARKVERRENAERSRQLKSFTARGRRDSTIIAGATLPGLTRRLSRRFQIFPSFCQNRNE